MALKDRIVNIAYTLKDQFTGKVGKITSGFKQVETSSDSASKKVDGFSGKLGNFAKKTQQSFSVAKGAVIGFAASFLAVGFTSFISGSIDAADKIQKLSLRLGISAEALSQYKFVADQTGVTFQTLTTAFQRQTRRIAEAAQGTGEAKDALKELGLSAEALNKLAPEEQFEIIADRIDSLANQSDKVRLAMKLWDTEGVALLQTIDGGSEAIRNMREEADQLGLTLSQDQVQAAADANDAFNKLSSSISGGFNQAILDNVGTLKSMAELFSVAIPASINAAVGAFNGFRAVLTGVVEGFVKFESGLFRVLSKIPVIGSRLDPVVGVLDNMGQSLENTRKEFVNLVVDQGKAVTSTEKVTEATNKQSVALDENASAMEKTAIAAKKLADQQEKQLNSAAKRVYEQTRTDLEKLNEKQAEYKQLLDAGKISQDTFNRAMQQTNAIANNRGGANNAQKENELSLSRQSAIREAEWQKEKQRIIEKQRLLDAGNPYINPEIVPEIKLPTQQDFDNQLREQAKNLLISLGVELDQYQAVQSVNAVRDAAQAQVKPIIIPVIYQNKGGNSFSDQPIQDAALAGGTR